MADNTCHTSICIIGTPDELQTLDGKLSEALAIPDSGDERWIGNLWLQILDDKLTEAAAPGAGGLRPQTDFDPASAEPDALAARITGHAIQDGVLKLETESADRPRLRAVRDFVSRYAPSARILFFAVASGTCTCLTNGEDHAYASVLFKCAVGSDDPRAKELDDWKSLWKRDDLLRAMSDKLGVTGAFDVVSKVFEAAYPVEIAEYAHVELEDYLR